MRTRLSILPIASALLVASAEGQQTSAPLALTGVTIIDGTGAAPKPNMTVVITGDRITRIFPTGQQQLPANTTVQDLRGQFLIPGLIDAHVHIGRGMVQNGTTARLLKGGVTSVGTWSGTAKLSRKWLVRQSPVRSHHRASTTHRSRPALK